MALIEEFNKSGNWLFKRRGYLPVFILCLALIYYALKDFSGYQYIPYMDLLYLGVSLLGLGIRIITIGQTPRGTSGRNIKRQRAETLNTTGIYSIVRHPLYLGNFIIWLGVALFLESLWCLLLFILLFWLYYERIMFAEEVFLREKFGKSFLDWSADTPAFFPRFRNWQSSQLDFSWRNVIKREYHGFINIFISFTFLDLFRNFFMSGKPYPDTMWIVLTAVAAVIWVIIHMLKKNTKLFHIKGR
jgi:protein-S-isoprenylcysteine O-methyltransferase Ste14